MFLKIGIVGRALGLQGSFYVSGRDEPLAPGLKSIKIGKTIETSLDAKVDSIGWQQKRPFIKCSLAADRTAAERLIGLSIWIEESKVQVDDSKEFLLKDLIGRNVVDSDGVDIGFVEDVFQMPASINMIVVKQDLSADLDIPVISDYVEMSFKRGEPSLKLQVPVSTFEEIWNSRVKK